MYDLQEYTSDMKVARFATDIERSEGFVHRNSIRENWYNCFGEEINDRQTNYISRACKAMGIQVR